MEHLQRPVGASLHASELQVECAALSDVPLGPGLLLALFLGLLGGGLLLGGSPIAVLVATVAFLLGEAALLLLFALSLHPKLNFNQF